MLSGVVPCFEPSRLVPKAQEAIAVSRPGYGPPAFAQSVSLDHLVADDCPHDTAEPQQSFPVRNLQQQVLLAFKQPWHCGARKRYMVVGLPGQVSTSISESIPLGNSPACSRLDGRCGLGRLQYSALTSIYNACCRHQHSDRQKEVKPRQEADDVCKA